MNPMRKTFLETSQSRDRVLIVSNRDDLHAVSVMSRLTVVSGTEQSALLFDTATFPMATDIIAGTEGADRFCVWPALPEVFGYGARSVLRAATLGSKALIELQRVRAIYWRRPRAPVVDDVLTHPELRRYGAKSSRETIDGVVEQLALHCRVVDPPTAVFRAGLKALQLGLARQVGLNVPRTIITNSPEAAIRFLDASHCSGVEVISKSPSDLRDFPAKTELVDHQRSEQMDRVRLSPTILQERIVGGPDLRIVVVGSRLFGMAQTSSTAFNDVDCRMDPAPRRAPFEPSHVLREQIVALQRQLGLAFGVYDFKCDIAGIPYFLEVNPAGQWLSVEFSAKAPIAEALALYLWHGPGGEWQTKLAPFAERDLESLPPFPVDANVAN